MAVGGGEGFGGEGEGGGGGGEAVGQVGEVEGEEVAGVEGGRETSDVMGKFVNLFCFFFCEKGFFYLSSNDALVPACTALRTGSVMRT